MQTQTNERENEQERGQEESAPIPVDKRTNADEIATATAENISVPCPRSKSNARGMSALKKRFTTKRMAIMAVFVALSYVVSFFEIPLFPVTPFLKLDFGNVSILLISFLLGPIEGVVVCALKECLRALSSSSGGVGEIANALVTCAYILLPSVVYRYKKGIKTVALCLLGACFIGTFASLLANRFVTFPLYMGAQAKGVFYDVFWWIVAFNFIKTTAIDVLSLLLYKRLSVFFKKIRV